MVELIEKGLCYRTFFFVVLHHVQIHDFSVQIFHTFNSSSGWFFYESQGFKTRDQPGRQKIYRALARFLSTLDNN
jgi:hypothetical protein